MNWCYSTPRLFCNYCCQISACSLSFENRIFHMPDQSPLSPMGPFLTFWVPIYISAQATWCSNVANSWTLEMFQYWVLLSSSNAPDHKICTNFSPVDKHYNLLYSPAWGRHKWAIVVFPSRCPKSWDSWQGLDNYTSIQRCDMHTSYL